MKRKEATHTVPFFRFAKTNEKETKWIPFRFEAKIIEAKQAHPTSRRL
jgi:hypothetical protein